MYDIRVCGETDCRFYDSVNIQCSLAPNQGWEENPLPVIPGNPCAWQDQQTGKFYPIRAPVKESALVTAL